MRTGSTENVFTPDNLSKLIDMVWKDGPIRDKFMQYVSRWRKEQGALSTEPKSWYASLARDQRPQLLPTSLHEVGFFDKLAAKAWIASELDFKGWRYELIPLYEAPRDERCLLAAAVGALEYHTEQTRPIERSGQIIRMLRGHLGMATSAARRPQDDEAFDGEDQDAP